MTQEEKNLLQTLERVFATKEDFDNLREDLREWKNDILNSNDHVARELKDLRQEVVFFHGGQRRQDETLAKHDRRLATLETRMHS